MKKILMILGLGFLVLGIPFSGRAAGLTEVKYPVPWVSLMEGGDKSLLIKQPDTEWFEATVNTPIGEGDMLWQEEGGRSEIYIDRSTYIRLDGGTGVIFDKLKQEEIRLLVTRGRVEAGNGRERPMVIDLPGQSTILSRGSMARIDVSENGESTITALRGQLSVEGPYGKMRLSEGSRLMTEGDGENPRLSRAGDSDSFTQWNRSREQQLSSAPAPPPTEVASTMPEPVREEMAKNGRWVNDPQYGFVWEPTVAVGWAPYRVGRWVYRPVWGWTWISYEPWGWWPYHYGRWVIGAHGRWVWCPVYMSVGWFPALVFWIEGPDFIAWQPWPWGVSWYVNLGPTYIVSSYVTVVRYEHFHLCNYHVYHRPWPGWCGSRCYVHYSPHHFRDHRVVVEYHRTPRDRGYVTYKRTPSDTRYYAHYRRPAQDRQPPQRCHYGSTSRPPNRMEAARPDRRPERSARNDMNPGREPGSQPDRSRTPGTFERPERGNNADLRTPGRDDSQPSRDSNRPTSRGLERDRTHSTPADRSSSPPLDRTSDTNFRSGPRHKPPEPPSSRDFERGLNRDYTSPDNRPRPPEPGASTPNSNPSRRTQPSTPSPDREQDLNRDFNRPDNRPNPGNQPPPSYYHSSPTPPSPPADTFQTPPRRRHSSPPSSPPPSTDSSSHRRSSASPPDSTPSPPVYTPPSPPPAADDSSRRRSSRSSSSTNSSPSTSPTSPPVYSPPANDRPSYSPPPSNSSPSRSNRPSSSRRRP